MTTNRSGTFGAIVVGKINNVKTISQLIDHIVEIREHRDGLVELPSQLRYVAGVLQLSDPADCQLKCQIRKYIIDPQENYLLEFMESGISALNTIFTTSSSLSYTTCSIKKHEVVMNNTLAIVIPLAAAIIVIVFIRAAISK